MIDKELSSTLIWAHGFCSESLLLCSEWLVMSCRYLWSAWSPFQSSGSYSRSGRGLGRGAAPCWTRLCPFGGTDRSLCWDCGGSWRRPQRRLTIWLSSWRDCPGRSAPYRGSPRKERKRRSVRLLSLAWSQASGDFTRIRLRFWNIDPSLFDTSQKSLASCSSSLSKRPLRFPGKS